MCVCSETIQLPFWDGVGFSLKVCQIMATQEDPEAAAQPAAVEEPVAANGGGSPEKPALIKKASTKGSVAGQRVSKNPRPVSAPMPGPGSHNPSLTNLHRQPAYSFGGTKKPTGAGQQAWTPLDPKDKPNEPVILPDADIKNPAKYTPPSWSFGSNKRDTGTAVSVGGAGPGTYEPKKQTHRAPAYTILGKPPAPKLPHQSCESGDLFREPYITRGVRDKPKASASAATPADASAAEGAEGSSAAVAKAPTTGAAGFKENLDGATNVDWKSLSEKLPTGKDETSTAKRKKLWKRADPNGNGYLSSAEVDLMVRDTVGEAMFSAKPVIQSAFHAARKSGGGKQTGRAADYIEKKEFRTLLIMLRQYYELYAMFNRLDTSDDRRIDLDEFKQGAEMVASWGVKLPPDQMDAEFAAIDTDGGGKILFDEFSKWAILKALDLEEDDDFEDGGELAKHEAVGYIEERNAKLTSNKQNIVMREPLPRLCYPVPGARIPVQRTPKFEPDKSPFSPFSYSRAPASPVFRSKGQPTVQIIGGLPNRRIMGNAKFLPNTSLGPQGTIAGLPYALAQLLLEKSKEDREANEKMPKSWTKEERAYGAESLELPKAESPKKLENKGGNKSSAKVAPA